MIQPMAVLNYPTTNYVKHKSAEPSLEVPETYIRTSSHTPDQSIHSATGNISRLQQERVRSNNERDSHNKNQVLKCSNHYGRTTIKQKSVTKVNTFCF